MTVRAEAPSERSGATVALARRDRLASAAGVAALHALLGFALLQGLEVQAPERVGAPLRIFELPVAEPPAPAALVAPPPRAAAAPEQAASPPPVEEIAVSSPPPPRAVARARVAARPLAPDTSAMPSLVAAPLTGTSGAKYAGGGATAGGDGIGGTGAVGASTGGGGGGGGTGARQRGGRLMNADYPRSARLAGAEGTVHVRFAVSPEGRAHRCVVTRSSGHAELDATTCRLIERRFRYDPARDAQGRRVSDVIVGRQRWWLERDGAGLARARPPSGVAVGDDAVGDRDQEAGLDR